MDAFAWIGQIVEALGKFIPRAIIIRATHGGVRWMFGSRIKGLKPGMHFYWPIITEIDILVTARQTLNLPVQVLMTKDKAQIVVGTLVVYRINDVIKAIGERNWDVECTVSDITQAAVVEVFSQHTFDELLQFIATGEMETKMTKSVRKKLRQFGVYVQRCAVTDFSTCRVYKVIGNEVGPAHHSMMAGLSLV